MGFPGQESRRAALLGEFCSRWGFCDGNMKYGEDLIDPNVTDPNEVVDVILRAEGHHPELLEKAVRRRYVALVTDWLFDPHGRGAQSEKSF